MWSKGHTPSIDDPLLQDAVKKYNMLETGFQFDTEELPALEVETINMIKAILNKKKIREQNKIENIMQGV